MTTLVEARDGLEAVLGGITNLRVYDYVPSNPAPPAAIIFPPVVPDYREDLGVGSMQVTFPVLLLGPSMVDRHQLDLYELIERSGARSVFAALEANRDLGGLDVDAYAVNVEDFDTERFGLNSFFGRVVNVAVLITGG